MAEVVLSLETLGELDGGSAREVINAALSSAVADTDDRGKDGKPRKVVITVELIQDDSEINIEVECKTALPSYRTHTTHARLGMKAGRLGVQFQSENPARPDQPTFDAFDKNKDE